MSSKIVTFTLLGSVGLLLVLLMLAEPIKAQTPTVTPSPSPSPTPWPTLIPMPTPTAPASCIDLTRGHWYRDTVSGTTNALEFPRMVGVSINNSFGMNDAQQKGFQVGAGAGRFVAAVNSIMGPLAWLIPADVGIVIVLRLLIMLILALIGLIAKLKTVIKWW